MPHSQDHAMPPEPSDKSFDTGKLYVILQPPDSINQKEMDRKFPENQRVIQGVWLVSGNTHEACVAVANKLGITESGPRYGVVIKARLSYGWLNLSQGNKTAPSRGANIPHAGVALPPRSDE